MISSRSPPPWIPTGSIPAACTTSRGAYTGRYPAAFRPGSSARCALAAPKSRSSTTSVAQSTIAARGDGSVMRPDRRTALEKRVQALDRIAMPHEVLQVLGLENRKVGREGRREPEPRPPPGRAHGHRRLVG